VAEFIDGQKGRDQISCTRNPSRGSRTLNVRKENLL